MLVAEPQLGHEQAVTVVVTLGLGLGDLQAGVKVGLPRDTATQLAAQTAFGAAKMVLETGYHPALLKDAVTTPAGCTIDGILELEEGGLRVTLIKAVMRATERAKQLAAG